MARKVAAYQIYDGSHLPDYTRRNHLYSAFADNPEVALDLIVKVLDANTGMDFVSMVKAHSTITLGGNPDGAYTWKLEYRVDSNYECVGIYADSLGNTPITSSDTNLGINRTMFFMDFDGHPFKVTELIEGENPDVDRLLVYSEQEVGNDRTRYQVQLAHTKGNTDSYDYSQVAMGTRWSSGGGATAKYDSDKGIGISFNTPTKAQGEFSRFRLEHKVSGHLTNYQPKAFHVPGPGGGAKGSKMLWLSNVEYEFLRKIRWTEANLIMNGRSNKWDDGSRGNFDHNAEEIHIGSGWREQIQNSNRHYFSVAPDFAQIQAIAMEAAVDKLAFGTRTFMIKAGEYGLVALGESAAKYGAKFENINGRSDTTGRNITWTGNDIHSKIGQVKSIATVQGIRFVFVLDPSKDSGEGRNKIKLQTLPGFASSYQYDIVGFGEMDEKANMAIIRNGEAPIYAVEEGMRGWFNEKGSFAAPKRVSNGTDASVLHYMETGIGAIIKDPTKAITYGPVELTYV